MEQALASAASAVLIGRAALYGPAAASEQGAIRSPALLREELGRCMAYAGVRSITAIRPQHLQSIALRSTNA